MSLLLGKKHLVFIEKCFKYMKNLYLPLSLPVCFLKGNFDYNKYSKSRQCVFDSSEISEEYYDFINQLGLRVGHSETFFSAPNINYIVHRDNHDMYDFPKINFIIGGEGSTMNWYSIRENKTGVKLNTNINTHFTAYTKNDVDLIYKTELKSPCLVQAGVPHDVTTSTIRWCISTVYATNNNKLLSWNEMIEIFKPYIIE